LEGTLKRFLGPHVEGLVGKFYLSTPFHYYYL
jgi:hypothetical protein